MEQAFSYAASAVAAGVFVDLDFSVHYFCCFVWTGGFDGTFFAAFTDIGIHLGDFLADDADIVQVWLDTLFGQPPTAILNLWGRATFR